MDALAIRPPGHFAVFESQFLPEYCTQRAKQFYQLQSLRN